MNCRSLVLLGIFFLSLPLLASAQSFIPLVGIPGLEDPSTQDFGEYINALYRLAISIAGLLAVLKIIAAGAKYMLTDVVTSKAAAKSDIKGALLGLLIVIGAVVLLNTINPEITVTNLTFNEVTLNPTPPSSQPLAPTETMCESAYGCTEITCGLDDSAFQNCEDWCQDRNGILTWSMTPWYGTCMVQSPFSIPCTSDSSGSYNCSGAISKCDSLNGEVAEYTDQITCSNYQAPDTISLNGEMIATDRTYTITSGSQAGEEVEIILVTTENDIIVISSDGTQHVVPCQNLEPAVAGCSGGTQLSFNGQSIDTSTQYTIDDGPIDDLPAGPGHGEVVQIIEVINSSMVRVETETGTQYLVGCALLTPPVPGCG